MNKIIENEGMDNVVSKEFNIAIDGPASSGKSTIAKILADAYQLVYIDTGAMYRSLTYLALQNNIDLDNEAALMTLLEQAEIVLQRNGEGQSVLVNGEDVTEAIRQNDVTNNVSEVASYATVREELVRRQQDMARHTGVAMDGRDIGTVVLPKAEVKIFLVASVEERAERRYLENKQKGISSDYEQLKQEIIARDEYDSNREVSPLKQADDAIKIDTTGLSIDEVVEACKEIIVSKVKVD